MAIKINEQDEITLSTRTEVHARYFGCVHVSEDLTTAERHELADMMIAEWEEFRGMEPVRRTVREIIGPMDDTPPPFKAKWWNAPEF